MLFQKSGFLWCATLRVFTPSRPNMAFERDAPKARAHQLYVRIDIEGIMKYFLVIITTIYISACSTMNKTLIVDYKKDIGEKYPPVSIVVNKSYIESAFSCYATGCYSYRDETSNYVFTIFRASNLFSNQYENEVKSPYGIHINTKFTNKDGDSFGKLMFGILTLFLIPTTDIYVVEVDISVYYHHNKIKSYAYSTEVEDINFLLNNVQQYKKDAMEIILSKFFNDLETDNQFFNKEYSNASFKNDHQTAAAF